MLQAETLFDALIAADLPVLDSYLDLVRTISVQPPCGMGRLRKVMRST